jgi:hypothetical protein
MTFLVYGSHSGFTYGPEMSQETPMVSAERLEAVPDILQQFQQEGAAGHRRLHRGSEPLTRKSRSEGNSWSLSIRASSNESEKSARSFRQPHSEQEMCPVLQSPLEGRCIAQVAVASGTDYLLSSATATPLANRALFQINDAHLQQ